MNKSNKDKILQQLEAAIGYPLPANEQERHALIEDLHITRPDLRRLLNQYSEPANLPLPEEAEASKAARRERKQATMNTLFYSPSPSGELALNKRKVLGVITALLVLTLPLAFIAQQLQGTAVSAPQPPQEVQVAEQVVPLTPGDPIPVWPEEEELWEEPATPAPPSPTPAAPVPQPVAAPPISTPPITTGGQRLPPTPGAVNPAITSAPPQWSGAPPTSPSAATAPLPLVRYDQQPQERLPLSAFNAPAQPRPPISAYIAPPRAAALSLLPQAATERAPSTVFAAQRQGQTALSIVAPAQPAPAALTVITAARQTEQATTPTSWVAPAATPTATAPVTVFARPPAAEAAPVTAAAATAAAPQAPAQPVQFAHPGQRIPAQLTTGIALVEGAGAPVAAETPAGGDWCPAAPCPAVVWLGQASLDGNNRVSISFTQAISDGQVRPVSGLALGLDHLPGLAANLRDATPTAALDLVRAAAGGVSDYVDALIDRRQIIIGDGQQIITDLGPPPLGQVVGGRIAQLFQLPAGQTAVVRVAEVPFGTSLHILYGVGNR